MKIEREEVGFNPITLTLETQAEFDALFIGLNHNTESFQKAAGYLDISKERKRAAEGVFGVLWNQLEDFK